MAVTDLTEILHAGKKQALEGIGTTALYMLPTDAKFSSTGCLLQRWTDRLQAKLELSSCLEDFPRQDVAEASFT